MTAASALQSFSMMGSVRYTEIALQLKVIMVRTESDESYCSCAIVRGAPLAAAMMKVGPTTALENKCIIPVQAVVELKFSST